MTNHEDINWGNTSTHGVNNKDLRLVRTSPHIDRWASDGSGSLIITPREDSSTYSRSTTHFTLNSIVQDHSSGTFSNGKYAVIGSLEDAAPSNTISGIGTVDTWMHPKDGRITLPNATLFAPEGEKLPERFDGLNVVRYAPDADQAKNYSNLTSTIESELSRNNIPTFLADSYGWHGVGMPPKEEVENLSRLVGSDKKLPTIHFGSPDSTMEGYLSNILKLKKYTEEDSFSPGSQSPMQQIDELEWNGKQYFDNVHPDTVDKYKQKEAEYLGRARVEVEKWRDKHYPPEPVNILPEGFPQPLGNSTSKPPPLPSSTQVPLIPSAMVPGMPPVPGASIPPPIPTNMPIDTPLDMVGKSSEWTPSKTKLPYEQQLLRNIADLQKEVQPDHHSVDGILKEGLFGGTNNKLNVDSNGNVVLTRFASDEQHLTKNWVNVGQKELLETSLFSGGGKGLPTSGFADWSFGLSDSNKTIGNFVIPSKDFLQGIRDKNIYLGNLGEGEFVLNPNWAKDYLSSINDKKVTVDKSGSVRYEGINSISDTPPEFHGKSSEFLPNELKSKLKALEPNLLDGYVLDAYREGAPYNKVIRMAEEYQHMVTDINKSINSVPDVPITKPAVITPIHQGIDSNKQSGVNTKQTVVQQHVQSHATLKSNSMKDFFKGSNLVSFDTETTNLDNTNDVHAKRGRIWQLGLATNGGIDGLEEHINPFFSTTADGDLVQSGKVSDIYLRDMLKHSNGQFSMKAYEAGNFNTFIQQYNKGELSSLDNAISKTLGSIDHNSVIVLQNMNFENSVLKSSVEQGILSEDIYKNIAGRMRTVGTDSIGNVTQLFQRPHSVVSKVREADMIFHTSYLTSKDPKDFTEYKNLLNEAVDSYAHTINDPKRSGVVAVELQDVTKAFLANAAEAGMIDKRTATLGLNIEFLAKTVLNEPEAHTALSDSRQTISLLQNLWGMTDELRTGTVSERTEGILSTIRQNQGVEVNKRFISSVRSVLSDFKQNGSTNIESSSNWYQPRAILREYDNEGKPNKLVIDKVSSSGTHKKTTSLPDALTTVLKRYSEYSDNLYNFNRSDYVSKIVKEHTEGANVAQLHTRVESDFFKIRPPAVLNTTENYLTDALSKTVQSTDYWKESVDFLGKSVTRKTRATVLGVAGAGLAVMAFQDRPEPMTKNYDNVSENFYDDQYLGTAFVDFRERNKHYMM